MASTERTFSGTDIQFLLTFLAGMAAFWLSGHLPAYLPLRSLHGALLVTIIAVTLALLIYGLCMFVWAWLILGSRRALRPALSASAIAAGLALATTLTLRYTGANLTHSQGQLALLAFILYLIYGLYFVIGWFVARKLAK